MQNRERRLSQMSRWKHKKECMEERKKMQEEDARRCEQMYQWIIIQKFLLGIKHIKLKFFFMKRKAQQRASEVRNAQIISSAIKEWLDHRGDRRTSKVVRDYILQKTLMQKRLSSDREAKTLINFFLKATLPRNTLKMAGNRYMVKVSQIQKRWKLHRKRMVQRHKFMRKMWEEEEERIKNSPAVKGTAAYTFREKVKAIPDSVKDAVIHKWLRYMKHIYIAKIMSIRSGLNLLGFKNQCCRNIFFITYAFKVQQKNKWME